ncbi:MAG: hypothetical protein QGG02_01265 [Gammaproteobacteria bacterium]|jgi:hypothetical protein|nr:hypothetical protein [Gammaproteobacteria bacterium]MDP6732873.1 hypothetical protein [Gammaproteobacteria bacterium]|tara:strand:+ start:740 stop:970 length:231 start_codon:yes stop_codon:yes gene_type:complete
MSKLFTLSGATKHAFEIDEWLSQEPAELFAIAREWFSRIREAGDDIEELIHDGCPVACVNEAAFAYCTPSAPMEQI